MHGLPAKDGERAVDWGRTSRDYAAWRPDYPAEFYGRLAELGVGRPGQAVLDLATGVGFLALALARRGCRAAGVDVSPGQIEVAREAARAEGLDVDFRVASAEATGAADGAFDAVTASQCWSYFDAPAAVREVRRVLRPGGRLAVSHFSWLPRADEVARASEELLLCHNPDWSGAGWSGDVPAFPEWARGSFELAGSFVFDARVPFTRESWRGRFRACRGTGATLSHERVQAFDRAHDELLRARGLERFDVLHRVDAWVLAPR